jgi:hypothetical protein
MAHAANALRIAIALDTHYTFTLTQLLDALYPHTCALCNAETHSFNVIRLQRLCPDSVGPSITPLCYLGDDHYNSFLMAFSTHGHNLGAHGRLATKSWDDLTWTFGDDVGFARMGGRNGMKYEDDDTVRIRLDHRTCYVEVAWLDKKGMGVL